ncbi:MAG: 5-amino-6-(D-ribitylamino)uracil--L-tyrosine 4-hydroxyphenyl transferase CofH [Acidimicrobiales bacterium]
MPARPGLTRSSSHGPALAATAHGVHPESPVDELQEAARAIRDKRYGTRITFSPKVFVPLTMLCRDRCGYCTFAKAPAHLDAPFLGLDDVLGIARAGQLAGCHEALFTLGEGPEDRYPVARGWLERHGYESTVDYLVTACRAVVEETGLLPHANAGALDHSDLLRLRSVSASQGMMLESLNPNLDAHRSAPDKTPERRLATLESAGRARIPFTTGVLVGIGDSREDRLGALEAIARSQRRYGHVQEVIVQNFLPKPGTSMHRQPACPTEELLWTVAAARVVLPPEVHLQAPPNLSDELAPLIASGIDDWGGVSPVTADHVNPERAWPALALLQRATELSGHTLAPRLTVYPEFALDGDHWLEPAMRPAVLDRSDAEGLARDHPWCSGGVVPPPVLLDRTTLQPGGRNAIGGDAIGGDGIGGDGIGGDGPIDRAHGARPSIRPVPVATTPTTTGPVGEVLAAVLDGATVGEDEIVTLFSARGPEVREVAAVADHLRSEIVGDEVTFVVNRNINYTNVCTFKCRFCAFSKGPLSLNLRGSPYLLELSEITDRVREADRLGATEVCLQGGIHPKFDGDYYLEVIRAVRAGSPTIHIHGFTALEVTEGARRSGTSLADYLVLLRDAGLKTLPGTAAEILDDPVRAVLCPDKIDTEEWLYAHRTAHGVGLRSNVTIMFGAVEHPRSWARHLVRTRALQMETGGFTEFVPLPFVHMATPLYLQRRSRRGPTFRESLLMHAIGRIAYRGLIDNIQVSWVKLGADGVRQLLRAGVNDLGGTLMDENISRAAGASHGQMMDADGFARMVEPLGRTLVQRTTLYGRIPGGATQTDPVAVAR